MKTASSKITTHPKLIAMLASIGLLLVSGCAMKSYQIMPRTSEHFPATKTVEILQEEPARPYETIAEFTGNEPARCPEAEPLCTLRERAKAAGADAIWIQEYIKTEQPGDWILVNNKMTKIYPYTVETYRGVFIHYLTD